MLNANFDGTGQVQKIADGPGKCRKLPTDRASAENCQWTGQVQKIANGWWN